MSERQKQTRFFRELMQWHDCDQCRDLQNRIRKAERDEWSIRAALGWAITMACFSAVGLAYSAVLLPGFFDSNTPVSVEVFSVLLMGSVISSIGFICFWCWYRRLCNMLYHECRTLIIALQKTNAVPFSNDRLNLESGPDHFKAAMV